MIPSMTIHGAYQILSMGCVIILYYIIAPLDRKELVAITTKLLYRYSDIRLCVLQYIDEV